MTARLSQIPPHALPWSRSDCFDLLPALYSALLIPDTVYQEYQVRVADGRPSLDTFAWIRTVQTVAQTDLSTTLDTGEASAITLAIQVHAGALLIDENRGRRIAQQHGLTIIGTMGILVAAKHRNLILSVASVLDTMIARTVYQSIVTNTGFAGS